MQSVVSVAAIAAGFAFAASGETLTFQANSAATSGGQYLWADKRNWHTDAGEEKVPAEGDDLVVGKSVNNFMAVNYGNYVKSVRFLKDISYHGVSWNGFRIKSGGEGLVSEGGTTGDKNAYSSLFLDGEVKVTLTNGFWFEGGFTGRSGTQLGRVLKYGPGTLGGPAHTGGMWTGATIHEGTFRFDKDNGKAGIDFLFDAPAAGSRLKLYNDITLKDGGLQSVAGLETTDFGVNANGGNAYTLTISGAPKAADEYFAGKFYDATSFKFAPDDPACTFTFAKATSPTTGRLIVANGKVIFADGASFPSLASIEVGAGATIELASDVGAMKPAALQIVTGAKVSIPEGMTWTIGQVALDKKMLAFGEYTAQNCDWIAGGGKLVINPRMNYVDPLYFEVPDGTTINFQQALTAYNSKNGTSYVLADLNGGSLKGCTFVKIGKGRLDMDQAMENFEGAVYVEEGILYTAVRYAIGKEWNAAAPVYVRRGATFSSAANGTSINSGRTFHAAGTGAPGYNGALHCGGCAVQGNYFLRNVFGDHVILDDDTTCYIGQWVAVGDRVTLNGHKLTLRGSGSTDHPVHVTIVNDDGLIEAIGCELRNQGTMYLNGMGKDNRVVMGEKGGWRFCDSQLVGNNYKNWLLDFEGPNACMYVDYNMQARGSTLNNLDMPTILNTMVAFRYQGDRKRGYLKVQTAPTGTGGFSSIENRTIFLHLLNPNNAFKGGLSFTRGTIWVYPNGSVPNAADAGPVVLKPGEAPYDVTSTDTSKNFHNTFDGIAFMTPDEYELPDLVVEGAFPSRVQGGRGAWRTITAKNKGVDYYSGIGAALVDVQKGYFKLPRGAQPGLWEGTNVYASADAAAAGYGAGALPAKLAVRGPTSIMCRDDFNYSSWVGNEVMTYSGYVWNRGGEAVTWTFASASKGKTTLLIDDNVVLSGEGNAVVSGNVTLQPGAHKFEFRALNGGNWSSATWPKNYGFAYDPQGRNDTSNTNNFQLCVDTGDGSLFTRTDDPADGLPNFGDMHFAPGAVLDLNGNAFTLQGLSGWPTVNSSAKDAFANASLTLADKYTLNAAERANAPAKVEVPLTLGTGFKVSVTNVANRAHSASGIVLTAPSITLLGDRIPVVSDGGTGWEADVVTAGDQQALRVYCAGLKVILR